MQVQVGQVVVSKAGRDQGKAYVVVDVTADGFALVADGKKRLVRRPKRKNLRHVGWPQEAVPTAGVGKSGALTDELIRRLLSEWQAVHLAEHAESSQTDGAGEEVRGAHG